MPNIHPIVVHFPIALLTAALLLDLLGIVLREDRIHHAAWWALLLGTVGAAAAVAAGLQAEESVFHPDAALEVLSTHETLGITTLTIFLFALLWRNLAGGGLPRPGRPVYLLLTALGVASLLAAGYMGGRLVYEFGVGVRPEAVRVEAAGGASAAAAQGADQAVEKGIPPGEPEAGEGYAHP